MKKKKKVSRTGSNWEECYPRWPKTASRRVPIFIILIARRKGHGTEDNLIRLWARQMQRNKWWSCNQESEDLNRAGQVERGQGKSFSSEATNVKLAPEGPFFVGCWEFLLLGVATWHSRLNTASQQIYQIYFYSLFYRLPFHLGATWFFILSFFLPWVPVFKLCFLQF